MSLESRSRFDPVVQLAQLLFLSALIVSASVCCVIGVRRLTYWTGLDRYFIGEVIVTFTWVLPEYLIALHALIAPGRLANHGGDPFISVGAILGAAAANMLVIGILNSAWPGRAGLETVGPGRPLAAAAVVLLVSCATAIGLAVGSGVGISLAQLIAGSVVFVLFLICLRLVYPQNPKEKPLDSDLDALFEKARGTLIGALLLAAASAVALVYASPLFVVLAIPSYRLAEDSPMIPRGLLVGSLTTVLGLLLALPDLIVSVLDLQEKEGDTPTPRLFLSSAALLAFTAIAGMDSDTLWNAYASSLFASFWLTVFVVAVTVVLLLAMPARVSGRSRGLVVTTLALAGLLFSVLVLGH